MMGKKYDGKMDEEVIDLCNIMNELSGIETVDSCCGHGKDSFQIFFKVKNKMEGLFILTRSVDRRYWKYGYLWKIELSCGDYWDGETLPISYCLHSGNITGEKAYNQANDLIENIKYHLQHENFIKEYKLNHK